MAKFLMLGRYSLEAVKGITTERTKRVEEVINKSGGKVNFIYALLGGYDLVLVVDFPDIQAAIKASVGLAKMSGIAFTTLPAIPVEEFDKIVG